MKFDLKFSDILKQIVLQIHTVVYRYRHGHYRDCLDFFLNCEGANQIWARFSHANEKILVN